MANQPHYWKNKEYESNLHKYRVARGFTVKSLALSVGSNPGQIAALANGTESPVYIGPKSGQLKPVVNRISAVLCVGIEDLFPRYFCRFGVDGLIDYQNGEMYLSQDALCEKDPAVAFDGAEEVAELMVVLDHLPPREQTVMRFRFFFELTLSEISSHFNVSRERVRQIERKAFRKIREYYRKRLNKTHR